MIRYSAKSNAQDRESFISLDNPPINTHTVPQIATPPSAPQHHNSTPPAHLLDKTSANDSLSRRANATLLILARNSDLDGVIQSIEQVELKFNRKFRYPWVLLNEVEFSAEFKR